VGGWTSDGVSGFIRFWDSEKGPARLLCCIFFSDAQQTLGILNSIDLNIVNSYYSQSLQTLPADLNVKGISEYTTRLLEVIELQTEGDGELYAQQLAELFTQMEARSPRYAQLVMESAVEMVLFHLRNGEVFRTLPYSPH
jgi:hypothetical protein